MPKTFGNCYVAAGKLFMDIVLGLDHRFPSVLGSVVLVHGYPTLAVQPFVKYGHAWLEIGGIFCYDAERDMAVPKKMFYSVGSINEFECNKYNGEAFSAKLIEFDHWGPWDDTKAFEGRLDGASDR